MKDLKIETKRGVLLDGVLFASEQKADTVLIAITGVHGRSALPLCLQRIGMILFNFSLRDDADEFVPDVSRRPDN